MPGRRIVKAKALRTGQFPHQAHRMNKWESQYALHLKLLKMAGEIVAYKFEAIKYRLADNTFYTPDFLVITQDEEGNAYFELHEVKGHWEDDARVKFKVAAEMLPWFKWKAISKAKGKWEVIDER